MLANGNWYILRLISINALDAFPPEKITYQTANNKTDHSCYLKRTISYVLWFTVGSLFSTHPGWWVESEDEKRRPPQNKMPNTTSLVLSVADESFQANFCKVFVFHTPRPLYWKRRPCSNLPKVTRRPQKPIGMLCLATLCSAFYVFMGVFVFGLRTYRPGCVENEDPTVIPTYPIERFGNRTQSNTNRSIAELNRT